MPSVLIVDDSVVARSTVARALSQVPGLEVLRPVPSGELALQRCATRPPDVVVLDVEMPGLGGLATLELLRELTPETKVIVFSGHTSAGAEVTLEALARGAADVVAKPVDGRLSESSLAELVGKIRGLTEREPAAALIPHRRASTGAGPIDALVVGVSTGGPNALMELVPQLPGDLPVPVLIVQHMPPLFTGLLAERLDKRSELQVREGVHGAPVRPGEVWIAPGDRHMRVRAAGREQQLLLDDGPQENSCRPAVDVLFRSAAACYGSRLLAVVMTGMGQDGLRGAEQIVAGGGQVLAQDEATSVVWGMPGAIVRGGLADRVLPLGELAQEIRRRVTRRADRAPEGEA
ncbi:MAG: chemotaxis-specific protein-glutamate methyltransferase CheB [Planctomycetes bacterium]|nr:chemotaxis-specific protein-glutamate methyltransferase CheB [Planctomycetota bacterium]